MKQPSYDHIGALIWGIVIGIIGGGISTLWNAPRSGRETRERLLGLFRGGVKQVQGETIDESIEFGKRIAQQHRADNATDIR